MAIRGITLMILITISLKIISPNPIRTEYDRDIETNTIDSNEPITDKETLLDDDEYITSTVTQHPDDSEISTERIDDTIIFKTFVHDGPLIVAQLVPVKLAERIPIFSGFRSVVSYEDENEAYTIDPLLIIDDESEFGVDTVTEFTPF